MAATHSTGTDHVTTEAPPAHDASDPSPQGQGRQGMAGGRHGMTGGRHGVQRQGRRGVWMPRTTQYHPPQEEEALPVQSFKNDGSFMAQMRAMMAASGGSGCRF